MLPRGRRGVTTVGGGRDTPRRRVTGGPSSNGTLPPRGPTGEPQTWGESPATAEVGGPVPAGAEPVSSPRRETGRDGDTRRGRAIWPGRVPCPITRTEPMRRAPADAAGRRGPPAGRRTAARRGRGTAHRRGIGATRHGRRPQGSVAAADPAGSASALTYRWPRLPVEGGRRPVGNPHGPRGTRRAAQRPCDHPRAGTAYGEKGGEQHSGPERAGAVRQGNAPAVQGTA